MNDPQEETTKKTLPRPELVSVYEYPAWNGMTVGQMLEDLYAEFASDLTRRKLEESLEQWVRDRLLNNDLRDWENNVEDRFEDGVYAELLQVKEVDCPPEKLNACVKEHRSNLRGLAYVLRFVSLDYESSRWEERPRPFGLFDEATIREIWAYRYPGIQDAFHPENVFWGIDNSVTSDKQLGQWMDYLRDAHRDLLPAVYWRLFVRLMPHQIGCFTRGEIPPLPRDLTLPDWTGTPKSVQKIPRRIEFVQLLIRIAFNKENSLKDKSSNKIHDWLEKNKDAWQDDLRLHDYSLPSIGTWCRYYQDVKKYGLI